MKKSLLIMSMVLLFCTPFIFSAGVTDYEPAAEEAAPVTEEAAPAAEEAAPAAEDLYTPVSKDIVYNSRGIEVPATLVYPENSGDEIFPLVIMVHGHGGGRQENGGFGLIAEEFAKAGIISLRMDFPGCGDSSEPFEQNNITNMLADIHSALNFALDTYYMIDTDKIGILGYSMGGRLAITSAFLNSGIWDTMALLAPSADKGDYANFLGGYELFHERMDTAEAEGSYLYQTPWGGQQVLGYQFFADMQASNPMKMIETYEGPVLAVVGSADTTIPQELVEELMTHASAAASAETIIVQEATHGYGFYNDRKDISLEVAETFVNYFSTTL